MHDKQLSFTDLAHRICAGDKLAEGQMVRRFTPGITQIIVRETGNYAMAQELCQETLIIVLQRLRTRPLDEPEKLPAFVAQTARNLVMAERRKERRRRTDVDSESIEALADEGHAQDEDLQQKSNADAISQVLAELKSARDRLLLIRYYLRDDDKKEICRDLKLSESSFNVVLFRARSRFLELLERRGMKGRDFFCWVAL